MVWSRSLWSRWLRVSAACFKVGLSVVGVHDDVVVVGVLYIAFLNLALSDI